jgi:hypothetical protein
LTQHENYLNILIKGGFRGLSNKPFKHLKKKGEKEMRIEITERKLYPYAELSDKAKQKALESLRDINMDHAWWDFIYEDAAMVGIEITAFDCGYRSYCDANILCCAETAELILKNHGEMCGTYKLAEAFKRAIEKEEIASWECNFKVYDEYGLEDLTEELEIEFKRNLQEEYLSMLRGECNYLTTEEAILETIECNEYEFTEDGEIA